MKMKRLIPVAVLVAVLCAAIYAQQSGKFYKYVFDGNAVFQHDMFIAGSETWAPATGIAVTSPTVTVDISAYPDARMFSLTADENQTAYKISGGWLNRVITVTAGTGSNTLTFNDGTSMTLSGNIVLTEGGSPDYLHLICTTAEGDEWAGLGSSVN